MESRRKVGAGGNRGDCTGSGLRDDVSGPSETPAQCMSRAKGAGRKKVSAPCFRPERPVPPVDGFPGH